MPGKLSRNFFVFPRVTEIVKTLDQTYGANLAVSTSKKVIPGLAREEGRV
jgi:hypothetical protein